MDSRLGFILVSFALGIILIMKKDSIPDQLRRPMALTAVILILFSFFLIVLSFLGL